MAKKTPPQKASRVPVKRLSVRKKLNLWIAISVAALLIVAGAVFFRYSRAGNEYGRLRILIVARAELGHYEWEPRTLEYTGGVRDAWCAYFTSWVYKQAGFPMRSDNGGRVPLAWKNLGVNIRQLFIDRNAFHAPQKNGGYQAAPGDVVVFGEERSHVGVVSSYSWNDKGFRLVVIEGNSDIQGKPDRVVERTYTDAGSANILGFGDADAFIDSARVVKR